MKHAVKRIHFVATAAAPTKPAGDGRGSDA